MLRHTLFFPFHGAGPSELKARSVDGFHLRMVTEEWSRVNRSPAWQDGVSYALAAAYGLVATVALVQLIRIQLRVPEYGWTTQKVFHLLNFLVNGVRATVFIFRRNIQYLTPKIFQSILLDLPGMLFFTTYTLLILFWAEIYYQVKNVPIDKLRPAFIGINAAAYTFQIVIWILELWISSPVLETVSKFTFAGISLCAALGFLLYGGRLHAMLRRFPVESKGRHKKLQEVGCVTAICFTCFILRAFMIAFSAIDKKADLDVLSHPILNAIYYMLVEILPSAFILFILRKLPPKRGSNQYHAIH